MASWKRIRNDNGGVEHHFTEGNVVIKRSQDKFVCTYLDYGVITGKTVKNLKINVQWILSQKKNRGSMLRSGEIL
tara:strand:- start:6172 stop:6396 length:225 start_codon:yes stop_codon:yes gene_type:complete